MATLFPCTVPLREMPCSELCMVGACKYRCFRRISIKSYLLTEVNNMCHKPDFLLIKEVLNVLTSPVIVV